MEIGLITEDFVLDGDPAPKVGGASLPNFRPISIVAKRLDASTCHLVWRLALAQTTLLDKDPAPTPKGVEPHPIFGPRLL